MPEPARRTDPTYDAKIADTHVDLRRSGWRRWVFPSVWLIYLVQTAVGVHRHSSGWASAVGYLVLVVFAAIYIAALPISRSGGRSRTVSTLVVLTALIAVESLFAHADAFVMCVYVAVLAMSGLGYWGVAVVAALTVVSVWAPSLVASWHSAPDWDMAVTLPLIGFAMYGYFVIIKANRELNDARAEVARLAAENERSRIARDLHDLLGHSLTTITVKAGLARRLVEQDPARAAREIGEVEEITRSTLADVRAAVAGYREVLLAGELATAAGVLRAAGIAGHLPGAVDEVRPEYRELFGWVVREGVTNVVRHSGARSCTVTVGPDWLEIADDGNGNGECPGTGLTGLTERVAAAGGHLNASRGRGGGFCLRVNMHLDEPADGVASLEPDASLESDAGPPPPQLSALLSPR